MVYASAFWSNPIVIIVGLLLIFGVIVAGVILVKKYAKPFQNTEKPKSDKEIAEEELNRLLVDVEDDEAKKEMENYAKKAEKASRKPLPPTPEEAAAENMARILEPVTDEKTARAMEEYQEEHPEEEKAVEGEKPDGEK